MATENKTTIGVEKKVYDNLIPQIDKSKFLDLHLGSATRPELFDFALALGLSQERKRLKHINSFWRWENMNYNQLCIYNSIWFYETGKPSSLHGILNGAEVITIVEEYANAGFQVLEEKFQNEDGETFAMQLIVEMNNILEELAL